MARIILALFLVSLPVLGTPQEAVPNFPLVNQDGKAFQLYDFKGQPTLVSFIFTRCPLEKMCPLTVSLNKKVLKEFKQLKSGTQLRFLLITLDPQFDTPEMLKKFANTRGLDKKFFTLATGNAQVLSDLASQFNVIGFPTGNTNLITHNLKTILLDPQMRIIKQFKDNEWTPKEVIQALLNGKVS